MTQEEKQLLLRDLCARLPYHDLWVQYYNKDWVALGYGHERIELLSSIVSSVTGPCPLIDEIKPYLRPMSNMTEEEKADYHFYCETVWDSAEESYYHYDTFKSIDWLNAHHFDYRGLIEKGLALEAPEGMYNKEESETGSEIPVPKTLDEAVKTLAKILSKEDRDYLLENGAISMHDSLGRWIRNEWGLWTGSELKDELMNMNKGLNHPDDMSNYIIEEFIKYWNNKI